MTPPNVPAPEAEATNCFYCGKAIEDGHWFARLRQGSRRIIFCCPHCVEMYLGQSAQALPAWSLGPATER